MIYILGVVIILGVAAFFYTEKVVSPRMKKFEEAAIRDMLKEYNIPEEELTRLITEHQKTY